MKKKKGFTLIELLAVIAVLAIILLLIVPNIVDMFNNGKKDAFIRQIQSVWREAEKEYTVDLATENKTFVFSDKNTNIGSQLKLNKTNITYVVGFDNVGSLQYIAVGNSEYCYVNNSPSTMEISREELTEGVLTCTGESCSCGSTSSDLGEYGSGNNNNAPSERYVYWSTHQGGYNTRYASNSKPAVTYNNFTDVLSKDPDKIVRTTLDANGNVLKHEACLYHNYRLFCLGAGYWQGDGYATTSRLQSDMEGALHDYAYRCYSGSSSSDCVFGCGCRSYADGTVACYDEDDYCVIEEDGTAYCN